MAEPIPSPPPKPPAAKPAAVRDLRLDFFRGVSLILIFIDHIGENFFSYFTLQAITFFDAAEVFIFVSGFTAALVYGRRLASKGALYATAQILRRVWQLYVAHVFLFVIFIAEVSYSSAAFQNPMFAEEMRVADFLGEPHIAVVKALMLQFQPTFLDILPVYIVMLGVFPLILLGLRFNWLVVVVPSVTLYVFVQVSGLSVPAYPEGHVWFFNPLAWQVLFVAGAALGYAAIAGRDLSRIVRLLYPAAIVIFIAGLIIKMSWTLNGVWESVPGLLLRELWPVNKNNLSPLRLIPFFALVVLVAVHIPAQARFLRSRAAEPMLLCGRHSLEIFCLGILLSALGHFIVSEYDAGIAIQSAVIAGGIAIMIMTGRVIDWYRDMERAPAASPREPASLPRFSGGSAT